MIHSSGNEADLRAALEHAGQSHVFRFWSDLSGIQRQNLLHDLQALNLAELPNLSRLAIAPQIPEVHPHQLEPAPVISQFSSTPSIREIGTRLIAGGKIAALTVAGGQGTRLGFDGPKGAFAISPVKRKSLFQLFAESILAANRTYKSQTHWYVMTSPGNDLATQSFFQEQDYFGLPEKAIHFFQQGVMPAFDTSGKVLLEAKDRLALSPDGHGGSLLALATTGMLTDMAARGIEYISYFQVDNPLVLCLDPAFIGFHHEYRSEMSSKTLPKADDLERVGNFVMADGKLNIIEYSDLPEDLARARNPDGTRRFDAANIAIHILSRAFVERLTRDPASFAIPWHRAVKKIPCLDLQTGANIQPTEPNGIKLEAFVFDALPLARNPILVGTSRGEEFSPVKNATGVDSVETARRDMVRRAASWLEATGHRVPRTAGGEPDALIEISPTLAKDREQWMERNPPIPPIKPGQKTYFE